LGVLELQPPQGWGVLLLSVLASVAVVRCPPAALFSGGGSLSFLFDDAKFGTFFPFFQKKVSFSQAKGQFISDLCKKRSKMWANCGQIVSVANCTRVHY